MVAAAVARGAGHGRDRPHRPLPSAGRGGGAGRGRVALLTVIFLCELSFARMSLSGVAGALVGMGLAAGGFALLLERCCRETRSYAPAVALRRAWRSALPPLTQTPAWPRCWRGWRCISSARAQVKNFAAALFISVLCALVVLVLLSRFLLGNALRLREKVFSPKMDLTERKVSFSKLAADRAPGADRGRAGDATVRRGPAQRSGLWQRRGAALRAGEEFALAGTRRTRRARPARTPIRWSKAEATVEDAGDAEADEAATGETAATGDADEAAARRNCRR